jgi:predicted  nucleic acid-binding Zn-ribbon protein
MACRRPVTDILHDEFGGRVRQVLYNRDAMDLQRAMEFILEQEAKLHDQMQALTEKMDGLTDRMLEVEERHDREMADVRAELRRAVRLSVQEHRNERARRQELDKKITQLAAAQVITEEKLQRLIDTLNQPRNGHHQ